MEPVATIICGRERSGAFASDHNNRSMCDCEVNEDIRQNAQIKEAFSHPEGPLRQAELHPGGAVAVIHAASNDANGNTGSLLCKILFKPFPVNVFGGACAITKFNRENLPVAEPLRSYTVDIQ